LEWHAKNIRKKFPKSYLQERLQFAHFHVLPAIDLINLA